MEKFLNKNTSKKFRKENGITLIALVITVIVLLILARSYNCSPIRWKWHTKQSDRSKGKNRRGKIKRNRNIVKLWRCIGRIC